MNSSTLRPLIDCDGLVYRVGFASDEDEPLAFALHSVNKTMESILSLFSQDNPPACFLSGKTNFRDEVATIQPYKGNRDGMAKPFYYADIRNHLKEKWGAVEVEGREADDALGETQYLAEEGTTCIVTQDKDLKTIKGFNYNWVKKVLTRVDPPNDDLFLLWQVLQGDRTDHIPGLDGIGEKKASAVIKDCDRDISKVKQVTKGMYQKQFGSKYLDVLHEVTTLLFIHREPGKTYQDYIGSW